MGQTSSNAPSEAALIPAPAQAAPAVAPGLARVAAEDVARVLVEFRGNGARNRLEVRRKPGLGTSGAFVTLERGSYRRATERALNRRVTRQLLTFVSQASEVWVPRTVAPGDGGEGPRWRVALVDAHGRALREREGLGAIAEPTTFLAFARGMESLARGLVSDTLPLARIEHALLRRDPLTYDEDLDRPAGGAIACAIGLDLLHEAQGALAGDHRDDALREARLHFLCAAALGSARAYAYLGLISSGLLGERDRRRMADCYARAARGNVAEGCYLLADLLAEDAPDDRAELRARQLYERAYALAARSMEPEVWATAAAKLAAALARGLGGIADIARARDLVMEAEMGLANEVTRGEGRLKPELERVMALSERLHA